jgi:2-hydroxychromene-2-carboxylate isomerase
MLNIGELYEELPGPGYELVSTAIDLQVCGMTITIHSYTIYHSPNAYLGTVLLRRGLAALPGAVLVRQPIFVPRERGVLVAEMLGGRENRNAGSYHREDCRRWAECHAIPFRHTPPEIFVERAARWARSPFDREELPARAYYAAAADRREALDQALFAAAWVEGLDVNEPATVRWAAARAGIDGEALLAAAAGEQPAAAARQALYDFDAHACPGVPTVLVEGERFFGKDRVDWALAACRRQIQKRGASG